jgi:hypothetical protein
MRAAMEGSLTICLNACYQSRIESRARVARPDGLK